MDTQNLIPAEVFCSSHKIEIAFIHTLCEYGLIEIKEQNEMMYICTNQLPEIEKYLRLHYDLNINVEGIEVVTNLLERMSSLQSEITVLKNRLKRYEEH